MSIPTRTCLIHSLRLRSRLSALLAPLLLVALLVSAPPSFAQLRPSLTFGHETWPDVSVSNLEADDPAAAAMEGDLSVWTDTRFVRASYPMMLSGGQTFVDLQAGFQRIQFRHDVWMDGVPRPTDAYIVDVTVLAQRSISSRWSLLGQISPALKSGFEEKLVREDFAIEGAVLATRPLGERSGIGVGFAYTTTFGAPFPIPLLQLEHRGTLWRDGPAWRGNALLPSSLEAWIIPARRLEVGLQLRTLGDRHHLTERGHTLSRPYSDYFDTVLGPSANVFLTSWMKVGIESGVSLHRQMQVTDGRDEVIRFEPNSSAFLRWQVTLGGASPLAE